MAILFQLSLTQTRLIVTSIRQVLLIHCFTAHQEVLVGKSARLLSIIT